MADLTHLNDAGQANMVDVGAKDVTSREAVASGRIRMAAQTLELALSGNNKKGSVLAAAELAGIMAAKKTSELIPLCHPLLLTSVKLSIVPDAALPGFAVTARVRVTGQTGVEMEALTAVSVACLTLYDMLKAADKAMVIEAVTLDEKRGGKSGEYVKAG